MTRSLLAFVLALCLMVLTMPAAVAVPLPGVDDPAPAQALRDPDEAAPEPGPWDHDDDDDDDDGDDDRSGRRGGDDDPVTVTGPIPTGSTVVSIVDDDGYTPPGTTIDAGGSVTFVNQHHDEHTATGSAFDTGIIGPGQTATVTFDTPGSYAFACIFHTEMQGTIGVRDATGVVPSPTPPPSAPPAPAAIAEVAIVDFGFEPTETVVAAGTTVVWTVTQVSPHTVTAADGSFDSDILDVGGTYRHTFTDPGTFAYVCRLHPDQMQASIVVDASLPVVSPVPASPVAASPSAGP